MAGAGAAAAAARALQVSSWGLQRLPARLSRREAGRGLRIAAAAAAHPAACRCGCRPGPSAAGAGVRAIHGAIPPDDRFQLDDAGGFADGGFAPAAPRPPKKKEKAGPPGAVKKGIHGKTEREERRARNMSAEDFLEMGVGGLGPELNTLFRRAFASRAVEPRVVRQMGVSHVKGVLLYGPPGTGKTLVARRIGEMLGSERPPKIVNGPELLQRYVGQSEENIRNLFHDAERDVKKNGDDADLHVIIFDEIDAICKSRGRGSGNNAVEDNVVNQLLTKMDGLESASNVIVVGITNRRDLLDSALLRPGRFEVQMRVGLPDGQGRQQILGIHTSSMRENNLLAGDVDLGALARDTENYSGAELAGLARSASSFAMDRLLDRSEGGPTAAAGDSGGGGGGADAPKVEVRMDDFRAALGEIEPSYGRKADSDLLQWHPFGVQPFSKRFTDLQEMCRGFADQVRRSQSSQHLAVLLEGPAGSGKTGLASLIASEGWPFARLLNADTLLNLSEEKQVVAITKAFEDAMESPMSCLVLDDLERILGFSRVGPVFRNSALQALMVLLKRKPAEGKRLLVIGTTSSYDVLEALELSSSFNATLHVPVLETLEEKTNALQTYGGLAVEDASAAATWLPQNMPVKSLLTLLQMAAHREGTARAKSAACWGLGVSLDGLKASIADIGAVASRAGPGAAEGEAQIAKAIGQ